MTEYDPRLVEFTEKLAALMEEYGAEIEVTEESSGWEGSYASGISIEIGHYKDEYAGTRFVDIETRYINPSDVRMGDK